MKSAPLTWIVGAGGLIGPFLRARLGAAARPFVALTRASPPEPGAAAWFTGLDPAQATALAAWPAEAAVFTCPLDHVVDWLPHCIAAGIRRVVAFGSTAIDYDHRLPASAVSAGSRAHAERLRAAEAAIADAARQHRFSATVLRPSLVYGNGRDQNVSRAARIIRRTGIFPIAAPGRGSRQPVHADDLAALALQRLAAAPQPGLTVYALGGGETLDFSEMIGRVFDALGRPRRRVWLPARAFAAAAAALGAGDPAALRRQSCDLVADDAPARAELGWAPRPFLPRGRVDLGLG